MMKPMTFRSIQHIRKFWKKQKPLVLKTETELGFSPRMGAFEVTQRSYTAVDPASEETSAKRKTDMMRPPGDRVPGCCPTRTICWPPGQLLLPPPRFWWPSGHVTVDYFSTCVSMVVPIRTWASIVRWRVSNPRQRVSFAGPSHAVADRLPSVEWEAAAFFDGYGPHHCERLIP